MSYEALKEALLAEAATQADQIAHEYKDKLTAEQARITKRAQALEEEVINQAEAQATTEASRLHQEHQLTAKANVLVAKQEELDATRDTVIAAILAWDEARTQELLTALLTLTPKDAEITAGATHATALKKAGAKKLTSEEIADEGGFVARGAESEINLTISHLVDQLFARHRSEIAGQLF